MNADDWTADDSANEPALEKAVLADIALHGPTRFPTVDLLYEEGS